MSADGGGFRLLLSVPNKTLALFEAGLWRLGGAIVTGRADARGLVPVEVYLVARPDPAEVTALLAAAAAAAGQLPPAVALEPVPPVDWVAESQKALPPVRAGRFFVFGSHVTGPPPPGTIPIRIDAGQAFGTGHHESSQGCLIALSELARRGRPRRSLDLGCGSGVLAIAMAKLWAVPVIACDLDPIAVRVARANARLNGVGGRLRVVQGDGFHRLPVLAGRPYDLIAANILAGPLCRMAAALRRSLAPGGIAILAGLLRNQERAVLARYRAQGMRPVRQIRLGEWVTLVLAG